MYLARGAATSENNGSSVSTPKNVSFQRYGQNGVLPPSAFSLSPPDENTLPSPMRTETNGYCGVAETFECMSSDISVAGLGIRGGHLGDITNVPWQNGTASLKSVDLINGGIQSLLRDAANVPKLERHEGKVPQPPALPKRTLFDKAIAVVQDSQKAQGMDSEWTFQLAKQLLEFGAPFNEDVQGVLQMHGWSESRRQFLGPPDRASLLSDLRKSAPTPPPPAWLANVPTPGRPRPRRGGA